MKLSYLVIDLETYGHKTYKRFCNPLDPNHNVVANAYKYQGRDAEVDYRPEGIPIETFFDDIELDKVNVIVGQNFKFDMLWFWKNGKFQDWLLNGGQIWDTLQAEYLLRGQQGVAHGGVGHDSMSLDALATKYGGTLKDKDVKDVFSSGGTVLDIPKEQLIDYAKEDVINTGIVFEAQLRQAKKWNMLPLIKVYNDHLLAVTEMEYNGMYLNVKKAKHYAAKLETKLEGIQNELVSILVDNDLWPQEQLPFKMSSPAHLSNLFFGGSAKVTVKAPMVDADGNQVMFKSGALKGELRTRNEQSEVMIPGLNERFLEDWRTDKGGRGTGVEVLAHMKEITKNELTKQVIELMLKHRKYGKVLSTYLYKKKGNTESGLVPLIHPDGCVHSEYQTVQTETGRLSSRNPNLQNIPPFVAGLFESRYGDAGKIIELDFSQLEIVVQAYITQCDKMIKDIESGIDFHCLRLSYAEGREYDEVKHLCDTDDAWKKKRKAAKVISFQKSYGAHTSKIASETGLPESVIEQVFEKENLRYPEINAYYQGITEYLEANHRESHKPLEVRVNGVYFTHPTLKQFVGKYQSLTGKIYTFYKKACKTDRGIFHYWPAPNIMNYPIQGTAADIVAMQTGKVFRYMIHNRDKGLMINEIHDSNVLDVKNEYVEEITNNVQRILESVDDSFQEKLNLKFNAPITVDAGNGQNWKQAK